MPMFTFCPNCHTIYRLTPSHLAAAGGYTRCGECRRVYSAVEYLYEDLAVTREALEQCQLSGADQAGEERQEPLVDDQVEAEAQETWVNDSVASTGDKHGLPPLPVLTRGWYQGTLTLQDASSGAAIFFLVLLLATQWVFFNRADLAREQAWRPGLEQFCEFMYCSLPPQVDLSQLEFLYRDVRQHPRVEDALLVNATLLNKADFPQPYPVLEVSFSDPGGNPVAVRRFRPPEYVNDSHVIERGMLSGVPVPVVLEILDPGTEALSYQFGFL